MPYFAFVDTLCGFTGNKNLLESDEYSHYADEAQYNIAYPVAAAIVTGDFGMNEVMEENMSRPDRLCEVIFDSEASPNGEVEGKLNFTASVSCVVSLLRQQKLR